MIDLKCVIDVGRSSGPWVEETANENGHLSHLVRINATSQSDSSLNQTLIDAGPCTVLAHPYSFYTPPAYYTLAEMLNLSGYAGIEIDDPDMPYCWDGLLSAGKHVHGFGVDDSHSVAAIGTRKWSYVYAESCTPENIVAALNAGQFYSSAGPILTLVEDGESFTVTTPAAATITFYGDNGEVFQEELSVTESTYLYPVTTVKEYVRAVVTRDSDSKQAWTNAVFIGQLYRQGLFRKRAYYIGPLLVGPVRH